MTETLPEGSSKVAENVNAFAAIRAAESGSIRATGGAVSALLCWREKVSDGAVVLMDVINDGMCRALGAARLFDLSSRTVAVIGSAGSIPWPDVSVDVIVGRGSFCTRQDRPQGLREIRRTLRPAGRAMIGGGPGSGYPQWTRREFIRRRRESARTSEVARKFAEARSPEALRRLPAEAGRPLFQVVGEGGLTAADDLNTGIAIWLRFTKEAVNDA